MLDGSSALMGLPPPGKIYAPGNTITLDNSVNVDGSSIGGSPSPWMSLPTRIKTAWNSGTVCDWARGNNSNPTGSHSLCTETGEWGECIQSITVLDFDTTCTLTFPTPATAGVVTPYSISLEFSGYYDPSTGVMREGDYIGDGVATYNVCTPLRTCTSNGAGVHEACTNTTTACSSGKSCDTTHFGAQCCSPYHMCTSPKNDCGNVSVIGSKCDGACRAQTAPKNTDCEAIVVVNNGGSSGVVDTAGIVSTKTVLVNYGSPAVLQWDTTQANICKVTGGDNETASAPFTFTADGSNPVHHTFSTSPITGATTYAITCWTQNKSATDVGPSASQSVRIRLNPQFREI